MEVNPSSVVPPATPLENISPRLARPSSGGSKGSATSGEGDALDAAFTPLDRTARSLQENLSGAQVADGALAEAQRYLDHLRELALDASRPGTDDAARATLDRQFTETRRQLERLRANSQFAGRTVLDGSTSLQDTSTDGSVPVPDLFAIARLDRGIATPADAKATVNQVERALDRVGQERTALSGLEARLTEHAHALGSISASARFDPYAPTDTVAMMSAVIVTTPAQSLAGQATPRLQHAVRLLR